MFSLRPNARLSFGCLTAALLLTLILAGCAPAPTAAPATTAPEPAAPAATAVPPAATATVQPPTATVEPTATDEPATAVPATAVPATEEPATAVPATDEPAATPEQTSAPADSTSEPAPQVPHAVAGREACLTCHAVGTGAVPAPADHEGRSNDLCLYCHVPADGQATLAPLPEKPEAEFCLGCHGPFEQLAKRTADFTTESGEKANPHIFVPHDSTTILDCVNCHELHPLPVKAPESIAKGNLKYCYSACHHQENFTPCQKCHEDMKK